MAKKLLILGTVAFDSIETPVGKADKIIGGCASYIAQAASYFDIESAVVSIVGNDFPKEYLNQMETQKIDTSGIEIVPDGKTFFWSGKYLDNMNSRETLVTELNVLEHFNPKVPESYKDASVVMLGNLHPDLQLSCLEQMNKTPKLVVMDTMNFWMDLCMDAVKNTLKHVDVLTINDEEARQLSGVFSLVEAAEIIQEMGPKYVIIKKGADGALLFGEGKIFSAPALPLKAVFDPTGAGDSFAGGFCGYLTKNEDFSFEGLKTAIIHGSNLASFCVESFGIKKLESIDASQIKNRLETFKELTSFQLN